MTTHSTTAHVSNRKVNANESTETFGEAYDRYLTYQENRIKESSYVDIRNSFRCHMLPCFESIELHKIHTKDIIAWQTNLNKKGLSFLYKSKLLGYLKCFFNYCVFIEESLSANPAKRQLKFIETNLKKEMLIYSPLEYKRFRSVIKKMRDVLIFDLLYFTGMRKGELMALTWSDLKRNVLSITKTYTRRTKDKKWKITLPKSRNSVRDILLPSFLVAELYEYKKSIGAINSEYIVGHTSPISERAIDSARNKYVRAARIKRIRVHDFRHSHVSYLIGENMDLVSIAKRIGDTVETILSTYAHLMPNKQREMVRKLDRLMVSQMM